MWLWGWHFYHSCLHIDERIVLNFKNLSLTIRDTLEGTPEVISNQNLLSRFQSWCWTAIRKINSKDKAFLENFCVNESSNLTGLENFWAAGFSITARFGGTPTISHHTPPNLPPPPPPPNLYNLPRKALLSPYYQLKWEIKVWKLQTVIKNFNNKISQRVTFIASLPHAKN